MFEPSRPLARAYPRLVSFEFQLTEPLKKDVKFTLSSTTDSDLIVPHPDDPGKKALNFTAIVQPVQVMVTLLDFPAVRFPENPYEAIGFKKGKHCPVKAEHSIDGMFHTVTVDKSGRRLSFIDANPGSGGFYSFALFLLPRMGMARAASTR